MEAVNRKMKLIVILGPTACGKTALSLDVAEAFSGEIISGDSMQIYRGMDIGTAKIRPSERRNIPHHMLDILSPLESFSVADFRCRVMKTAEEITQRNRIPVLVGGTGLYISSLLYPYSFSATADPDPDIRRKLAEEYTLLGPQVMHQRLEKIDPEAAKRIHPNDQHRVIRALEVYQLSGKPISSQEKNNVESVFSPVLIGLTAPREKLYHRIETRVDAMIEEGLVDEVQRLMKEGLTLEHQAMQGIGYRQIAKYVLGEYSLAEAIALIKRDTRRFAKRQMTWFRRMENIQWFNWGEDKSEEELNREVCDWLVGRI